MYTPNQRRRVEWTARGDKRYIDRQQRILYTLSYNQKIMAQLFDCSTDNIGLHLKNIFKSGELVEDSVTEKNSATAADGKNYMTKFYNLDAIISVGYRVNSIRATQFRQWCTYVIRQFCPLKLKRA